eukprot:jgi/Chlat1/8843/Chrsp91S09258
MELNIVRIMPERAIGVDAVADVLEAGPPSPMEYGELYASIPLDPSVRYSKLHHEILALCERLRPTKDELERRVQAFHAVRATARELWPTAQVSLFGSCATGLDVPGSDIDIAILHEDEPSTSTSSAPSNPRSAFRDGGEGSSRGRKAAAPAVKRQLNLLTAALKKRGLLREVEKIAHAKVPLLKCVQKNGVICDIAFNANNGPLAVPFVREQLRRYMFLRPLLVVLKLFLDERGLNRVFTGGVGSYCLLNMVISHLQMVAAAKISDLGYLLMGFLERYGRRFDYNSATISIRAACYFSKAKLGWLDNNRPDLLSVEDPQAPDVDIGKGSFKINVVRDAFDQAYMALHRVGNCFMEGSVLCHMLKVERAVQRLPPELVRLDSSVFGKNKKRPHPADTSPNAAGQPPAKRRKKGKGAAAGPKHVENGIKVGKKKKHKQQQKQQRAGQLQHWPRSTEPERILPEWEGRAGAKFTMGSGGGAGVGKQKKPKKRRAMTRSQKKAQRSTHEFKGRSPARDHGKQLLVAFHDL